MVLISENRHTLKDHDKKKREGPTQKDSQIGAPKDGSTKKEYQSNQVPKKIASCNGGDGKRGLAKKKFSKVVAIVNLLV